MIASQFITIFATAAPVDDAVAQFRAAFPAFAAVSDATTLFWLARAARQVDATWTDGDRLFGQQLLAAHLMTEQGFGTGAEAESAAAGASGFQVMKSGALTLQRFAGASGAAATGYATTSYGRQFAILAAQNRGGVRVTDTGCVPAGPFGRRSWGF